MSFSGHARRAGDRTVPLRHRVSSLRSCIRAFPPAPYRETVRYLELVAGPFHRDEAALEAALDLLIVLRTRWKAQRETYAAIRRIEKRRGVRKPRPGTAFGGSDEVRLFQLHTPRGLSRLDSPVHSRPNTGLGPGDGRSFHLGADHHTHADRERPSSGWPAHHPHSDKPEGDGPGGIDTREAGP